MDPPAPEDSESSGPSLADYVEVLRRRAWIVLPALVLIPLVAVLVSAAKDVDHTATAKVELLHIPERDEPSRIFDALSLVRFATTQAQIAGSDPVVFRARQAISRRTRRPIVYEGSISVAPDPAADLLHVRAEADGGAGAIELANEVGRQYIQYRRQIDTAALRSPGRARSRPASAALVEPADSSDAQPRNTARNAAVGLGAGLVLGLGLALVAEAFDNRVRSNGQFRRLVGAPVLGAVGAAGYETLRLTLGFEGVGRELRSLMVVGPTHEDPSAETAARLASAFARAGVVCTVVDADLDAPQIAALLGSPTEPGVVDVMLGDAALDDAIVPVPGASGPLSVLPAGDAAESGRDLLASPAFGGLLEDLRGRSGVVLVAVPPLRDGPGALAASAHVDAALFVVTGGAHRAPDLRSDGELLQRMPARTLGIAVSGGRARAT